MIEATHTALANALRNEDFQVNSTVPFGANDIALAHLEGSARIEIWDRSVAIYFFGTKVNHWDLKGFDNQKAALAYATAAAKNMLKREAAKLLAQPVEVF